ncbi:hypothetical protein QTP70_029693 [Hemibagrus guttatus]|uniref:Reverse transcriptase domain-containing protein n=1 Tax=Hemibagrus guttatus TaxID=175788 RepID=A0AAE0Q7I2_9TELE|nr:hypothetical protein QTP70_029693 [Hemibagrus guttatus]
MDSKPRYLEPERADDIVICSESREQVEKNLERWRFALERRGMKVSRSKTEYMCVNEREGSGTVRLQGEEVKKVQEFKYLGSTVQSNGECGKETALRVQTGVFKTAALREDSTVDLEEYAAAVTGYISTGTENIIPTKHCKIYPNDKPWINCEVRAMLCARSTAFVSGDIGEYKKARYNLCKSIRKVKRDYSLRLEGYYTTADSRRMWQGL